MSRQDKATTERHSRILRELVKRPDNKLCADCKRNDPRWASWNIGVFVCIRCSGIHRSMGTHISKVKSVDLDIWTPEQMESIKKWGNHRANLYWEAHLKPGHIPADHKMESFIRSKYESRRWAMDGPPPADPSVLEVPDASAAEPAQLEHTPTAPPPKAARHSSQGIPAIPGPSKTSLPPVLSKPTQEPPTVLAIVDDAIVAPVPKKPLEDLFSLDFHSPPPITDVREPKNVKSDILSLFDKGSPAAPMPSAVQPPVVTSLAGQGGAAMWGVQSSFPGIPQANPWGAPPQINDPFGADIWSSGSNTRQVAGAASDIAIVTSNSGSGQRTTDAFSDLWGDFK